MTEFRLSPRLQPSCSELDPYRFPAVYIDDLIQTPRAGGVTELDDYPLPAPAPAARPRIPLKSADRRRLELHAALTMAAIAPLPGDLDAIEALCELDDTTHVTLRRWLSRTS